MTRQPRTNEQNITIFWSRVDKSGGDDACWNWTGSLNIHGYGVYKDLGVLGAHRTAYFLTHGNPGSLYVLHGCDNPKCCNPAHLHAGTHQDNVREKMERGRHPSHPNSPFKMRRALAMIDMLHRLASQSGWVDSDFGREMFWLFDFEYAEGHRINSDMFSHWEIRITDAGRDFLELQSLSDRRASS